ncbi:unnamed protein product [Adineta steineri]|uniref:Alpha/beta hydrolase fold-3 domain-containing protein n=1 Tax=Adineta steineri TaxID=433720 RepID=A0A814VIM7_9BILA|nr:unnamed protein product [Adineta steineri]CAF3740251.1 unnamed protein product [Adineta steineri]
MFSGWVLSTCAMVTTLILMNELNDKTLSAVARYSRMKMMHRILTMRNAFFPILSPRPKGMSAGSKALDEIIDLYHPRLFISENVTNDDVTKLRDNSKQMLTSLHPARTPSCIVRNSRFDYGENYVYVNYIQHNQVDDWKTSHKPFVLYFHGGGFVFGGIETYSGLECHLSKELNMLIIHVEFFLSPENSHADTLLDVIGVYETLLAADPNINERLIGMGDSSGGMLWIHLLQWIATNNKPVPKGVVLHSPWPSLSFDDIGFYIESNNYLALDLAFNLRELAIGKNTDWHKLTDEEKRRLSPKEDSYEGFPPLYITAGTNEIFIKSIRKMVTNARKVDVSVTYDEAEGSMHTFALFHLWASEAQCVQKNVAQWIQQRLLF